MAGVTGKKAFLSLTRARLQKPMATVALSAFSVETKPQNNTKRKSFYAVSVYTLGCES